MIWIAPSEKDAGNAALEKRLWDGVEKPDETRRLCRLNLAVHSGKHFIRGTHSSCH